MSYDVVCPLAFKDVDSYFKGLDIVDRFIDARKFVVIGNEAVKKEIEFRNDSRVVFIDETKLVSIEHIKQIISKRTDNDIKSVMRSGWYLQQFLKYSYSFISDDEYYLLWDADTIPIHKHDMFVDCHPVFDMKTEYNLPYFVTFSKLFPNYKKRNSLSYISEHMLVKTDIMRELIKDISDSKISGDIWYEKIINSIEIADIKNSGFSDYETYGLYCLNKYPELYIERSWNSLRPAGRYFDYNEMRECDIDWLKKDYDAMSFEAGWKLNRFVNIICRSRFTQKYFSCRFLLNKILHQFTI